MQHVAMIMDGNRRWARSQKLKAVTMGHKKGAEALELVIRFCIKRGIRYLSLYIFSLENFRRDETEVSYLFNLFAEGLEKNLPKLIEQGVKIQFIGDRSYFPRRLMPIISKAERETKDLDTLYINFLFCYGAKQELLAAVRGVSKRVASGELHPDQITEEQFRSEFWLKHVPDPDLIIRTGRRTRLSNFLLFQAAYSELMFLDYYWPEITEEILDECVDKFYDIQRNFGT